MLFRHFVLVWVEWKLRPSQIFCWQRCAVSGCFCMIRKEMWLKQKSHSSPDPPRHLESTEMPKRAELGLAHCPEHTQTNTHTHKQNHWTHMFSHPNSYKLFPNHSVNFQLATETWETDLEALVWLVSHYGLSASCPLSPNICKSLKPGGLDLSVGAVALSDFRIAFQLWDSVTELQGKLCAEFIAPGQQPHTAITRGGHSSGVSGVPSLSQ